jgi:transposase
VTQRISTRQASREYGIPERTIRRWHAEGRLCDPERRGRTLWWDVMEIDQLAEWRRERQRERVAG